METTFYVSKNRIDELKTFIKVELSSARFLHNPYKEGNKYYISLELSVNDGNKLSELTNYWYNQDDLQIQLLQAAQNAINKECSDTKLKKLCFVIKSFFSKLFCLHEWGETICGGIHYSYRYCNKCGKKQNNGSSWD